MGKRNRYSCSKIAMTSGTRSSCTISSPRCVWPSKPMWSRSTRRSCPGSTGQSGRQLAPSSAAVTRCTVAPAGVGGAVVDGDAAAVDGVAVDGDGVAGGGGGGAVHCSRTEPAAITASSATLRLKNVDRRRVLTAWFRPEKTAAIGGFAGQGHVPLTLPHALTFLRGAAEESAPFRTRREYAGFEYARWPVPSCYGTAASGLVAFAGQETERPRHGMAGWWARCSGGARAGTGRRL